jgi:hypothetical protein
MALRARLAAHGYTEENVVRADGTAVPTMDQLRVQRIFEDLDTLVNEWSSEDSLLGALRQIRGAVTSHVTHLRDGRKR